MQQLAGPQQVRVVSTGGSPIAQRVVTQVPTSVPAGARVVTTTSPVKGNVASPVKVLSPASIAQGASPVRVVQQAGPASPAKQVVRVVQAGRTVGGSFQAPAPAAVVAGSFQAAAPTAAAAPQQVRVVAAAPTSPVKVAPASPAKVAPASPAKVAPVSPAKVVTQAKPGYPQQVVPVTTVRVQTVPQAQAAAVDTMPISQEPESKFPGLRIGAFARVKASGIDGKITKSNGHAFKLGGKWYGGDELEFGTQARRASQQVEEDQVGQLVKPAEGQTQGCFVGVFDKMRELFSPKAKSSKTTRDYSWFSRTVQVGGFARVKANGATGKVDKTNGHAFKVAGRWYLADELEPTKG